MRNESKKNGKSSDEERNIHAGHRMRVYESFEKDRWLETFSEVTSLELLLYIAYPRMDTNIVAHRLLSRFGTMAGVFSAPVNELIKIDGISRRIAHFLRAIPAVARKSEQCRVKPNTIKSITDAIKYLKTHFNYMYTETMYIMCLDASDRVLSVSCVAAQGTATSNTVSLPAMIHALVSVGGTKVILAHNHPTGILMPSVADLETTNLVLDSLAGLDSVLVDHLIFAPDDSYLSFFNSGIISTLYKNFDLAHNTNISEMLLKEKSHSINSKQEYVFDIETASLLKKEEFDRFMSHRARTESIRTRFTKDMRARLKKTDDELF